ncbi:MAG: Uncharacterized protein XE11_0802 [Methanomicrobiales archaeon 53_19]|uniref:UPF0175 family protein n=1 Tax=Methanocalculus sp. TaxID=2004547 RepID=UPI0007480B80|nr:UPF0175 family protein [Methanocalculus sp.]KUK69714.1 MAG: Uncharacterized protein XD88_1111 [Methanocalculus sp. 52_23]KUL04217.1 MAG: Uncharacterized protein XE11_0802 [Methanomicrobiales archaeon 53_19]HIJ07559.1 UPF0175 family protein [Methanocalculus sp.]
MPDITITVPKEIVSALRLPPDSVESALYQELAVALYMRGVLSSGWAATLAGLKRWQWEELLGVRKVLRHYTDEDLQIDIAYGSGDE